MAGLLDGLFNGSPEQQGLMAAYSQLMQDSGPSLQPRGLYQSLGRSLNAGQDATQQAQQQQQIGQMRGLQIKSAESDLAAQQRAQEEERLFAGMAKDFIKSPGQQAAALPGGPTAENAARIPEFTGEMDIEGYTNAMMAYNPLRALEIKRKFAKPVDEFDTTPRVGKDKVTGEAYQYILSKGGKEQRLADSPRDEMKLATLGDRDVAYSPYELQPGQTFQRGVSPDTRANNAVSIRGQNMIDRRAAASAAAASSSEGLLPDNVVDMMAQQYLVGDTSVMQNLGRGAQGAQNIIRLRTAIAKKATESGKGGADLAAQNAEYFGTKAGQRAAGTRIANVEMAVYEAQNLVPLALDASRNVARSGLLPFGKSQVMFNEQTNSPEMREFAAANNALVNTYARAISPTGQPTISDKDHARELLSTAYDQPSYEATVNQMNKEMEAARKAPQQVRQAFNSAVTGRGGHDEQKAAPARPEKPLKSAIKGQVIDGYRFKGGNPADRNAWEKI